MSDQYLMPMARNTVTGVAVKLQNLSTERYNIRQRSQAEDMAVYLAEKMTSKTKEPWVGFVTTYTLPSKS